MHDQMERLYRAVKELQGLSGPSNVARALNVSPQTINNWEDRGISKSGMIEAQKMFGISTVWLESGGGPMTFSDAPVTHPPDAVAVRPGAYRRVPLLGKAQGGMPERIWDSDGTFEATWDEYAEVATLDPRAFLSRVVGMSMYPRFRPGELALIEPDTDPAVEDDVLVRLRSGETLLKRLLWRGESVRLGSYNESSVLEFPATEVLWLYYAAHPLSARKLKQRV